MGQKASKGITEAAGNLAAKVTEKTRAVATPKPSAKSPTEKVTQAANPALFLRGQGAASHDVRDTMQEMYLQQKQLQTSSSESPVSTTQKKADQNHDLPDDLLKFIQDVGPAKQTIDKAFTSPKLLKDDHAHELEKSESSRNVSRDRRRMPLMGNDTTFTTERNTNFSEKTIQEDQKDFGVTTMQFFQLLRQKQKSGHVVDATLSSAVSDHTTKLEQSQSGWTPQELEAQESMLKAALSVVDLPTLRRDQDGNIFGLFPDEIPGPEVKSVHKIPPTKAKLALQDILGKSVEVTTRLSTRRSARKS